MSELAVICVMILAAYLVTTALMLYVIVRMGRSLITALRISTGDETRDRTDAIELVSSFAEKLMNEPEWVTTNHLQERHNKQVLDTSLRREEIRQQKKNEPPSVMYSDELEPVPKTMEEVDIQ